MKEETLRTLEYEKILAMLAAEAGSFLGKETAGALLPSSDFDEVEERLDETAEARDVLAVSSPPLGAIRDIRAVLKKAAMDAMLEIEELSDVISVLSPEGLQEVMDKSARSACRIISRMLAGNTTPNPLQGNLTSPCSYCGMADGCPLDSRLEGGQVRKLGSADTEED